MKNQDLLPIDEYQAYNKKTQKREFVSSEAEVEWNKKCLDNVVELRETYDKCGIGGKIGITYLGLRAFGILLEIGPELDQNDPAILDGIGFALTYVGGACWLSAKLLQYTDERSSRKDYEKALGKFV